MSPPPRNKSLSWSNNEVSASLCIWRSFQTSCMFNMCDSYKGKDSCVSETVIAIPSSVEDSIIVSERKSEEKTTIIGVKRGEEDVLEEEMVCRICHLNNEQDSKGSVMAKTELIHLGCGCNGELSVAHLYCAESWFKLKGNRICEICGETVNNIRGIGNHTFMEEWVDNRANNNTSNLHDTAQEGCWSGQPLCNFLMACLVIAFVVPWFFHLSMF